MAYLPILKTVPQYVDSSGDPYSGAVLKAYESGTSTVLAMATDSTGGTTATSMALNSDGYVEVSGNIVIPHVDENYKLSLYPTQADADANTGAIWTVDAIQFQELTGITFDANNDATFTGTALFAAGEGIVFNGDALAADNTLDDYEEGTWTPVLSDGPNNATSSVAVGYYTKIGRMVTFTGRLTTSSLGSVSGSIRITGLPFPSQNIANSDAAITVGLGSGLGITAGQSVAGVVNNGTSFISIYLWDVAAGSTTMQGTEWTADGDLIFGGTYYV